MAARSTMARLSGLGASFGLAALVVWPFCERWPMPFLWLFIACAAISGLCGGAMMALTLLDLLFHRRRSSSVRPARVFDVVLGAALLFLGIAGLDHAAALLPAG